MIAKDLKEIELMFLNKKMPKARSLIITVTVFLFALFLMGCNPEAHSVQQSTESSRTLPSRSDFENLDKELNVEQIIDKFGNCGYEGSGIIYHVWHLDDGSKAKLVFNSEGKIEFIYIATDDSSERIYDRNNS